MRVRNARRRGAGRDGPAPELVAAMLVVLLYGATLAVSSAMFAGTSGPSGTEAPRPSTVVAAPSAALNPHRADISAILEVDARLSHAREDLRAVLARTPFRGSDVAFVLRRINTALLPGMERAGRLSADPSTREIGAQLEILYANASAAVDRASDLALGSDLAYRQAAEEMVDLFTDLPAIDARLEALLDPAAAPTPVASGSPAPTGFGGSSPSTTPGSLPPPSAAIPSARPGELLGDPGLEVGMGPWSLHTAGSSVAATVSAAAPLGAVGTRSLEVDVPAGGSPADVGIGQGPIILQAGSRYLATLSIRSSAPRTVQLRVVGPAEETYSIKIVEIGPATVVATLEFASVVNEPSATFWIDLGGPAGGTVWLDDASLVRQSPS